MMEKDTIANSNFIDHFHAVRELAERIE